MSMKIVIFNISNTLFNSNIVNLWVYHTK
jgi:hypothetical protein